MSVKRGELKKYINSLLRPYEFSDYCPNGLQIEGAEEISKIAFAVSATINSVNIAASESAQALVVHHGLFWKFHGTRPLTGPFAKRVFPLVKNEINLFGYHLPLDAHLEVGNAASLAKLIDLDELTPFGDYKGSPTGVKGKFKTPISANELQEKLQVVLNHPVMLASPDKEEKLKSLGIITGGANSDWVLAMRGNLDGYLTGEMSEHDWHESQEAGVHMFAGGHNATEQFGIQSLMQKIEKELDVECFFIPSENPA
jgi:dinuclear metal center YbgI/SA1388 family protein